MHEITRVILENEMDVILAHKQGLRLCELAGFSIAAQTTFATAISEVSRNMMVHRTQSILTFYISDKNSNPKYILTELRSTVKQFKEDEGYNYAKRLVSGISRESSETGTVIELKYILPHVLHITDDLIGKWQINMNNDPAISPYEEIKRQNRRLMELSQQLQQSEQQYRHLADSLPIMIYTVSSSGDILYANEWMLNYTGYSIEEINNSKWRNVLHPEDYELAWEKWNRSVAMENSISRERRLKDFNTGEYRWHTGVSIAITSDDGQVKHWNTFMVDIHAQKVIEQALKDNLHLKEIQTELEEKVNLLNKSNQQLEQFAYVASHDLQEPLRKISYYCDYLKHKFSTQLDPGAKNYFDNIIGATTRMKNLITDILLYSTINRESDALEQIPLSEVIEMILSDMELQLQNSGAAITYDNLPVITGNYVQIKQLFGNLISNSVKYIQAGTQPEIHISVEQLPDAYVFNVKDNGIGFDMQFLDRMFGLFQRLHTKDKYSGTGIGLAICKKIVDFHNGRITARSEPGAGAEFLITLPIQKTE